MSVNELTDLEAPINNETMLNKEQNEENTTSSYTNQSHKESNDQSMIIDESMDTTTVNGIITKYSINNNDCQNKDTLNDVPNDSNMNNPSSSVPTLEQQDTRVFGMLNLLPRKRMREINEEEDEDDDDSNKGKNKVEKLHNPDTITEDSNVTPPSVKSSPHETASLSLARLFKKDPNQVIALLSKISSMDSLCSLLKEEHQNNSDQLKSLKEKVEKAHTVLTQCAEKKSILLSSIEQVTNDIQLKRNQLAQTREELRELSMREGQVKSKRDTAYEKCTDLRKKGHACREAIQQINSLYGKKRRSEKTY